MHLNTIRTTSLQYVRSYYNVYTLEDLNPDANASQ